MSSGEKYLWLHFDRTVLDAPLLRDDFYCSLLAYSSTTDCLAVGLGNFVYLWSHGQGINTPKSLNNDPTSHVTSLSFSSVPGGKGILAIGRADGRVILWAAGEEDPRFDMRLTRPVSCLSFRPVTFRRLSQRDLHLTVDTEELLVGDEDGKINYYSVEWPDCAERDLFNWTGQMTLLCQIRVNSQQICGLAWSAEGDMFAAGGNDNICALFETSKVLKLSTITSLQQINLLEEVDGEQAYAIIPGFGVIRVITASQAKQRWVLNAAVKAVAFCPWQRGLIALGGGSNDRCIHFYHILSGACLASIDCSAQVTSLIWSRTRREVCATFGFAQPEHPYRVAVFAWPSCEQVMAIPWYDEHRALYAVPFPGGPKRGNKKGREWRVGKTSIEGSIIVATSDATIKFHEIWAEGNGAAPSAGGLFGGSVILGSMHTLEYPVGEALR